MIGAGWAGNPYSYAGNDPLHAIDPLGLRPVTEDELTAYRESNNGALAAAGDWMSENWEYVVAGAAIVVGVGLMFTGVGGPAGLALMASAGALVSGGISVASQKHQNGTVDWGKAGVDAAIGGSFRCVWCGDRRISSCQIWWGSGRTRSSRCFERCC